MKRNTGIGIGIALIIIGGVLLIFVIVNVVAKNKTINSLSECQDLVFFEQVECMYTYVEPFYNYTVRDDTIKSFNDVTSNGGDCFDWSHLWKGMAEELGLDAEVTVFYGKDTGHAYVIIWEATTLDYCIIDGLNLVCWS